MKTKRFISKLAVLGLVVVSLVPLEANAATGQLSPRKATLSNSAASASVTATFAFTPSAANSGATIKGIKFEICNSPVETTTCTAPDGVSTMASATSGTQSGTDMVNTYGSPSYTGATEVTFTNSTGNVFNSGDGLETFPVQNITLPATANQEFYFRITTYNSSSTFNGTTEIDYGGIAEDTTQQLTVSGTMPESLVFCVGKTWNTSCSDISGSAVNLGTFSPVGTNTGTSVMDASTNAGSGYAITVNGTVPTSGSNTIAAMGTQSANSSGCAVSCTSTTGTAQFGTNVRANTTPTVGADVTPTGAGYNGAGSGGYNTANSFRFFTGDTVASSSNVTNAQLFTNSYIVNVGGAQAAGLYTATMTYICTATF